MQKTETRKGASPLQGFAESWAHYLIQVVLRRNNSKGVPGFWSQMPSPQPRLHRITCAARVQLNVRMYVPVEVRMRVFVRERN